MTRSNSVKIECDLERAILPTGVRSTGVRSEPPVGYLLEYNGRGLTLENDLSIAPAPRDLPGLPSGSLSCVGLIKRIAWEGGPSDPIDFFCCVTKANAHRIKAFQVKHPPGIRVELNWWIGPRGDGEAVGFYPETRVMAALDISRGEVRLNVSSLSKTICGVPFFEFEFGLIPAEGKIVQMELLIDRSRGAKPWGEHLS